MLFIKEGEAYNRDNMRGIVLPARLERKVSQQKLKETRRVARRNLELLQLKYQLAPCFH